MSEDRSPQTPCFPGAVSGYCEAGSSRHQFFFFGDRKALRLAKLPKTPHQPEEFRFRLLGMEVTGIGWFPSRCAMVISLIGVMVLLAHIVGAAADWWSMGISLPNLSAIRAIVQG
ncbi:hypothetical protein MZK49_05595 [Ensifer sesbaniae]|uniref:hypothetical protein n=1 Tax=Ensifer sesbaniae TaxID=1214071 RepID=UPI0020015F94|nr:hypothetical protein [Ensifer sesbaniae]